MNNILPLYKAFCPYMNPTDRIFLNEREYLGTWVEGFVSHPHVYNSDTREVSYYYFNEADEKLNCTSRSVIAATLCEFTGFVDKKGNKIYENAIIRVTYQDIADPIYERIFYDKHDGCWKMTNFRSKRSLMLSLCIRRYKSGFFKEFEVIGNVFTHEQLLRNCG